MPRIRRNDDDDVKYNLLKWICFGRLREGVGSGMYDNNLFMVVGGDELINNKIMEIKQSTIAAVGVVSLAIGLAYIFSSKSKPKPLNSHHTAPAPQTLLDL